MALKIPTSGKGDQVTGPRPWRVTIASRTMSERSGKGGNFMRFSAPLQAFRPQMNCGLKRQTRYSMLLRPLGEVWERGATPAKSAAYSTARRRLRGGPRCCEFEWT